jgi:hypothetical protein
MRKSIIFLTTLMLACGLAGCSGPPTLKEFKSEAGGFSVMAPAPLQEASQEVKTPGGKVELHLFSTQQDDTGFYVGFCDYDPQLATPDKAEKMLDGARDGAVSSAKGKLVSEAKIDLSGHPGRELVIEASPGGGPPTIIKGRLFMVKNRLYQVTVVTPRGKARDKIVDDYLRSFKLLNK